MQNFVSSEKPYDSRKSMQLTEDGEPINWEGLKSDTYREIDQNVKYWHFPILVGSKLNSRFILQPLILPGKMKNMTLGFQHNKSVFKLDSAQFIHEFIIVPLLDLLSEENVYANRKAQLCLRMSTAVQQPFGLQHVSVFLRRFWFGGLGGYRYKKKVPHLARKYARYLSVDIIRSHNQTALWERMK